MPPDTPRSADAVQLELFTNRFETIARDMGEMLQRTALSTNVKERRDFSCALLDSTGNLVVNAPHIPVHLGGLGLCVRRLLETLSLEPGDAVVTNHPGWGGTHLPDVTVVTPVFTGDTPRVPLAFVASRAHHAEVGGTRPGSVAPDARCLAEEGVVIRPTFLVRRGMDRSDAVRHLLESAPFPSRAVEENLADLAAAAAANHLGARALAGLAARHGTAQVTLFMDELRRHAAALMEDALGRLPDGLREAEERLDDGSLLVARITIEGRRARIDLSGSAPVHPGNLNATPAVVRSVILYVLRLLISEPLPLNEGLLEPIEIDLGQGMLNPDFSGPPTSAPAVVGGNVETSQRLVDTLLKALQLRACSQGTMNNVVFGDERLSYYETVAGGCGAGPDHDGASAVHSHMTNTAATDPEVLEHRYPVRLERLAVRRGSGGAGRRRGGDGIVRELRFLRPLDLSLLSQHRAEGPYGLHGGQPGAPGRQHIVRAGGRVEPLDGVTATTVEAGDLLVLETPGGGGWGTPR